MPVALCAGAIDHSRQAFAELADLSVGRLPITWCGIQVIDHRNPVAALEVRTADGRRQLPRTDHNCFLSADGTGCGGALRITDIYGEQLAVDGIAVRPDVAQPTGVQSARRGPARRSAFTGPQPSTTAVRIPGWALLGCTPVVVKRATNAHVIARRGRPGDGPR
ncbi:hypothetical protein ABT187_12465 [Streptomyces sp. NPDC001817]|uniref:hypothetical protein n=1 Tax=Streptomyces sp. NPDC001817 TaxID=3154398 RepID=UPI0033309671